MRIVAILLSFLLADGLAFGQGRQRVSIDNGWRFMRYAGEADSLIYDVRPMVRGVNDSKVADTRASEVSMSGLPDRGLKKWILPTANDFIVDVARRYMRPAGDPGHDFPFVREDFDDREWEAVTLPHDWAIKGPFYVGEPAMVGGGMGRMPVQGVGWYRRKLDIPASDAGKRILCGGGVF